MENILPIIIADAPEALTELCGVNLLERLLRILQRLGFRSAIVFSTTPEIIRAELAKRSWARQQITTQLVPTADKPVTAHWVLEQGQTARFLIVPANVYCDRRLLAALSARNSPTVLVDSNPPQFVQHLIQNPSGPALVTRDFLLTCSDSAPVVEELKQKIDAREIDAVDAAKVDDYIVSMRRRVRPLCFSAPPEQSRRVAERVILDSAQNGTLDLPAYIHAPIETAIISLLCKTRITPNQITIGGFVIGCSATAAFALGRVGLLFPNVFYFFALLIGSHVLDHFARRRTKMAKGRLLDDVAPFDRAFRLIAARRNVYVWILACGFLLGAFPQSYAVICGWAAFSAAVHLVRSIWIRSTQGPHVVGSRA